VQPVFAILSGPSCVGKGPLLAALRRCHPDLPFVEPVVHTSRPPRPGERDGVEFHFRSAETIRGYPVERFFVYPMRHQLRAIDLDEVERLLRTHERVLMELHPAQVGPFRGHPRVAAAAERFRVAALLLQPLAIAEAEALAAHAGADPAAAVADVMRVKQIARAHSLGMLLTAAELADIDVRAEHAWAEMQERDGFDQILVNHDAEGSDHWRFTPPIGDAGRTLAALVELLTAP
jgi:guanylate kinase